MFVGGLIVRKTDIVLSKEGDVVVCFPGAKILSQRGWKNRTHEFCQGFYG